MLLLVFAFSMMHSIESKAQIVIVGEMFLPSGLGWNECNETFDYLCEDYTYQVDGVLLGWQPSTPVYTYLPYSATNERYFTRSIILAIMGSDF